jgi:hypothetical protein
MEQQEHQEHQEGQQLRSNNNGTIRTLKGSPTKDQQKV